jgi:hypothetical protein
MTNFEIKKNDCVVYFGKNNLDGAPLHFFIKNSFETDILSNKPCQAAIHRVHFHNTHFTVDGVELASYGNWAGIEFINPEVQTESMSYILHHLNNELTFEKPLESAESIWSQTMIVPAGNQTHPLGVKMTLAILPENAKVIMPPAAADQISQEYHFKRFGLIRDYIKFNQTPLPSSII